MYLLDTVTVNYLLTGNAKVVDRLARTLEPVYVNGVVIEEILVQGYGASLNAIRSGRSKSDMERAYRDMAKAVMGLSTLQLIPFTNAAEVEYKKLKALLRHSLHKSDGRIAAHALTAGYILVTENTRDFEYIPGLRLDNWAL